MKAENLWDPPVAWNEITFNLMKSTNSLPAYLALRSSLPLCRSLSATCCCPNDGLDACAGLPPVES